MSRTTEIISLTVITKANMDLDKKSGHTKRGKKR